MAKTQSRFVCQNCGRQSPRYMGRCPSCGEFNTMVEEVTEVAKAGTRTSARGRTVLPSSRPQRLKEIGVDDVKRYYVPIGEFNRVLGGGLVPGSIILIGGDPGIGKCVSAGTWIQTDRGLIQIGDLYADGAVAEFAPLDLSVKSTDGARAASHFYNAGIQPIKRATTRMGYQLEGTYTHAVLTLSKDGCRTWKALQDLQVGDYVAIQRHSAVWGNKTAFAPLPAAPIHHAAKHPTYPTHLQPDTAYVLGLLIGDGSLANAHDVGLTTNDPEIQQAFQHWTVELGLHASVSNKAGTTAKSIRIASKQLLRWLEHIGVPLCKSYMKSIPTCILESTEENARAFLQGLFDTDGSAFRLGIEFCTVSETLARQVHLLLLQFGIAAKLRFRTNKYAGAWTVNMQGNNARLFYDQIGFRLPRKQANRSLLPETSNNNVDVIPYLPAVDTFRIPTNRKGDRRYIRGDRAASYEKLLAITEFIPEYAELLTPPFFWDALESIEDAGESQCYDLCVPETHAYVTNGIVSHNSTLVIQTAAALANNVGRVLYVSGEESTRQIKMRADRLSLQANDLFLLTETNLAVILEQIDEIDPTVVVIDSIQTIYTEESESSPGSVSQVRECASRLQMLAKTSGMSVFLIGHVTKEGAIAGPRVLEHIVDTVLYLEGDPFQAYRLLRSVKNRFGATSEIGVFEMSGLGMIEVPNPSEVFLAERVLNAPGTSIAVTMEGTRPLLVEVQALTSPTSFGNPRRTPNGVDMSRLLIISAVLTKRFGLKLHEQDIFLNVIGGLKLDEPAVDLAMAMAIASSYYEKPLPNDMVFIGEIGLSGELRPISQLIARLNEAAKMGFKRAMIPRMKKKPMDAPEGLKLIEARNVGEALAFAVPND